MALALLVQVCSQQACLLVLGCDLCCVQAWPRTTHPIPYFYVFDQLLSSFAQAAVPPATMFAAAVTAPCSTCALYRVRSQV